MYENFEVTKEGYRYPRVEKTFLLRRDAHGILYADISFPAEVLEVEYNPVFAENVFRIPKAERSILANQLLSSCPFPIESFEKAE